MGSMIHVAVDGLEIDWGKNDGFRDHSALFQPGDLTQVPYWYVDEDIAKQYFRAARCKNSHA